MRALLRAIERRDMNRPRSRARRYAQACRTARRSLRKRVSPRFYDQVKDLPMVSFGVGPTVASAYHNGGSGFDVCALNVRAFEVDG